MPLLTLKTNIRSVREHLERFAARVEKIPAGAIKERPWLEAAKETANQALLEIAGDNAWLIPRFVDTVNVIVFGSIEETGMIWSIDRVRDITIKASELTMEQRQNIWANRGRLVSRDIVEDWVAQFKDKTEVDDNRSNADIARRLLAMMFGGDAEQQAGAEAVMFGNEGSSTNYLVESIITRMDQLLSPENISLWLDAVRIRWRELILEELPMSIRMKIRAAWIETKGK